MTSYTYTVERIDNGHQVSAHQDGVFRWAKSYRGMNEQAAIVQAQADCPVALEHARLKTFEEIVIEKASRSFKFSGT